MLHSVIISIFRSKSVPPMYRTNRVFDKKEKNENSRSTPRLRSASPKPKQKSRDQIRTSAKSISATHHFAKSSRSLVTRSPVKTNRTSGRTKLVKAKSTRSNSAKRSHSVPVRSPKKQKKIQGKKTESLIFC